MVSFDPFFVSIPWKEWLEFPVTLSLVLSKEIKNGASYFVRVLDIEIPSIPWQEMSPVHLKNVVSLEERVKGV
jgi:hypothetical protein